MQTEIKTKANKIFDCPGYSLLQQVLKDRHAFYICAHLEEDGIAWAQFNRWAQDMLDKQNREIAEGNGDVG